MKKGVQKNKSGISLIVLVITIIVIIILAVAVILSISNNNPIENARKARFLNDLKTIQEEITLHIGTQYANDPEHYNPSTDPDIQKIVDKYTDYSEKIQVVDGKVKLITDKVSEQESKWAEEVGISSGNNEVSYEPTIPIGFSYMEGTVDTGYVIQNDADGNEFVWVPVNTMEEFVRESFTSTELDKTIYVEPYNGTDVAESETAEYDAMIKSVKKYHGFYIARYEASNNGSGVAQSKKNQPTLKYMPWGDSMTDLRGGAVEKARRVYPDSTSKAEGSAVSTLCYGVQWDQIVRWLEKTYPGISSDSSEYGNYDPTNTDSGSAINTGSNEKYKTNNIYDMCGNMAEWTMEAYEYSRIFRGGTFGDPGNSIYGRFSSRTDMMPSTTNGESYGFRLALYIK